MKKSISLLLCFSTLLCLSLHLFAQGEKDEPDQVKLLKQFTGTWTAETGEDSTISITYEPVGDGFLITQENMANGVAYRIVKAVMGVSRDKKTIIATGISQDGVIGFQYGRFVSEYKGIIEFYYDDVQHPINIQEFVFKSPEEITVRGKYRGEQMTWDAEWWDSITFQKIE
jgi:hypothetical protein